MLELTRLKAYLAAFLIAIAGVAAVGCGDDNGNDGDGVGDQIEQSANDVEDAANDAADDASDAADDAGNEIDDAADDVGKDLQGDDKGKKKDGTD